MSVIRPFVRQLTNLSRKTIQKVEGSLLDDFERGLQGAAERRILRNKGVQELRDAGLVPRQGMDLEKWGDYRLNAERRAYQRNNVDATREVAEGHVWTQWGDEFVRDLGATPKLRTTGSKGGEYVRVHSQPVDGQKHRVIKANLQPRGTTRPDQYADQALDQVDRFGHLMSAEQRTAHISPRFIQQSGTVTPKTLDRYEQTHGIFSRQERLQREFNELGEDARARVDAPLLTRLEENNVQTKVLQDGRFRIKYTPQGSTSTTYRLKPNNRTFTDRATKDEAWAESTVRGLRFADRVAEQNPYVSTNVMLKRPERWYRRTNKLAPEGLNKFDQAAQAFSAREQRASQALQGLINDKTMSIKLKSDGTIRIRKQVPGKWFGTKNVDVIVRQQSGQSMENFIGAAFQQAERLATAAR